MSHRLPWFLMACLVLGAAQFPRAALASPSSPKILLHLMPTTSKNTCVRAELSDCTQAVTNGLIGAGGSQPYFLYLLAATGPLRSSTLGGTGEGVAAVQCGITYNAASGAGVDVFGWSLCAMLEFSSTAWPASGGGNLVTWDSTTKCQLGEVAVAGYFYIAAYTPDTFSITPRPVDGKAQVAKCSASEINLTPSDLGTAKFSAAGTDAGINPCGSPPPPPPTVLISQEVAGNCLPEVGQSLDSQIKVTQPATAFPIHAYSIGLQLQAGFSLTPIGITEGAYLQAIGPTFFQVIDHGAGSYTVDCALLGQPCANQAATGTLFNVNVVRTQPVTTAPLAFQTLLIRDCTNAPIPVSQGSAPGIDITPPTTITNLTASPSLSGNPPTPTHGIQINFTQPPDATVVEVYRAPFGQYPEYDDAGGSTPATPSYPPPAPWQLTTVTASGQYDVPSARDYWYYVVFTKDTCGNVSAVSNRSSGTLNYLLGDVSDSATPCSGDNRVTTADISLLGSNYGRTLTLGDPAACVDIGPTSDLSVNGRPLTDDMLQFEDLVLFSINYGRSVTPRALPMVRPAEGSASVSVELGPPIKQDGHRWRVPLLVRAPEGLQAISLGLAGATFDEALESIEPGELLTAGEDPYLLLQPDPARLDIAGLAIPDQIRGEGVLAWLVVQTIGVATPRIEITDADARTGENSRIHVTLGASLGGELQPRPFLAVAPNPFRSQTAITLRLAEAQHVSTAIFDLHGRRVRRFVDRELPPGEHRLTWDGRDDAQHVVPSGIYTIRSTHGGEHHSIQVVVVR